VVAKVRKKCYMKRFNINNFKKVEGKEQGNVEISSRITALENLDTEVNINTAWKTIGENIKMF
jgi:hypothetical protein